MNRAIGYSGYAPSVKSTRSLFRRASTWWIIGGCLLTLCLASLIAALATNLVEGPLTRWIESHPTFKTSRLSYVSAWQYAFGWLEALFTLGCAACVVASFLTRRDSRVWRRLVNGQCPACTYPIGTSEVCTECGSLIPAGHAQAMAGMTDQSLGG